MSVASLVSAEWLLSTTNHPIKRANGGGVIFLRASFVAAATYLLVIASRELLDPHGLVWNFSVDDLRQLIGDTGHVLGVFFGGALTSLYARFASQWNYVANMYNQIKAAQVAAAGNRAAQPRLIEWKAGFIEDAGDLHLAPKKGIASTIVAWSKEKKVKDEFLLHCADEHRWNTIVGAARKAHPDPPHPRDRRR